MCCLIDLQVLQKGPEILAFCILSSLKREKKRRLAQMNEQGRKMIERYLAHTEAARKYPYAENTKRAIKNTLQQFFEWWQEPLDAFGPVDLEAYKDFLWSIRHREKPYSISTVNQRLVILRKFCEVARDEWGIPIKAKPAAELIEVQNIFDVLLENDDAKRLAKAAKKKDPKTYILILGLFYTGARVSEILQVRTEVIGQSEIVVRGKGRKYRRLFIPARLSTVWKSYAKEQHFEKGALVYQVSSKDGHIIPMSGAAAYNRLRRLSIEAGVDPRRVHPHAFRHLYARNLQAAGVPTAIIKQILGHRLDTTEGYLQFSREQLMKIIEQIKL